MSFVYSIHSDSCHALASFEATYEGDDPGNTRCPLSSVFVRAVGSEVEVLGTIKRAGSSALNDGRVRFGAGCESTSECGAKRCVVTHPQREPFALAIQCC